MQILIEIPEEMYQKIKETNMIISGKRNGKRIDYILFNAVNNGKPLPEGHGRLIDINELIKKLEVWDYKANGIPNYAWKCIKDAQTIIEEDNT